MDNANVNATVNATYPGSVHVQSSNKGAESNEGVRSRGHTEKGRQYITAIVSKDCKRQA